MDKQQVSRHYKTIDEFERHTLETLLKKKIAISEIARIMNRPRRSIQREIKRGLVAVLNESDKVIHFEYSAVVAQQTRATNFSRCGSKPKHDADDAKIYAKLIHEKKWSPAAVVAYATQNNLVNLPISESTLYTHVAKGLIPNTSNVHLPRKGLTSRRSQKQYSKPKEPCFGESIENRPEEINSRKTFGHWEGDLVCSGWNKKGAVLTLLERKTRYLVSIKLPDKKAESVDAALNFLEKKLKGKASKIIRSITFDNGREFSHDKVIEQSCLNKNKKRWKVYYCHPYTSCERGSNENANGLLRRAGIPKGCDISNLEKGAVAKAAQWVNKLPREILGFKTAAQAFREELFKLKLIA